MADLKDESEIRSGESLNWYALHTRSRHEKRIAERLSSQELETFLPVHRSRHTWKNGYSCDGGYSPVSLLSVCQNVHS